MPSFDLISEINMQEMDNAIVQAQKEVAGRYDFRGSKSQIEWDKKEIKILAEDEYKLNAMKDILQSKVHKRGIDLKALKFEKAEASAGQSLKQLVKLVQGIEKKWPQRSLKPFGTLNLRFKPRLWTKKFA